MHLLSFKNLEETSTVPISSNKLGLFKENRDEKN